MMLNVFFFVKYVKTKTLTRSGKVVEIELKSMSTSSSHLITLHRRRQHQDLLLVHLLTFD